MWLIILIVVAFLIYKHHAKEEASHTSYTPSSQRRPSKSGYAPKVSVTFITPSQNIRNTATKTNANNDYANVLFLDLHKAKWKKPHTLKDTEFFAYKTHRFGVNDPLKKHADMLKDGYFREATSSEILNTYRKAELEEVLRKRGIVPAGKKADLIKTITESISPKELNLPTMYFISGKGMKFIDEHKDLIELSKNNYRISYEEYISAKKEMPSYLSYNDLIWGILNRRELSFSATDDMSRRDNAFFRAEFLRSEEKYDAAIVEYFVAIFYDVNKGIHSYKYTSPEKRNDEDYIEFFFSVGEHTANKALQLKEYYSQEKVLRRIKRTHVSRKYISEQDYINFIEKVMEKGELCFVKYAKKAVR